MYSNDGDNLDVGIRKERMVRKRKYTVVQWKEVPEW